MDGLTMRQQWKDHFFRMESNIDMFGATAGLCKTGQPELLLTETAASRKGQDLKGWDQWDL